MSVTYAKKRATRLGLLVALIILLAACSSAPQRYRYAPPPSGQQVSQERHEVVRVAADLIGTPYRYGGTTRRGFDCSGLVQYSHRQIGISVPRTTTSQWRNGRELQRQHLLPGDLLFFDLGSRKAQHVGIYEGDGLFIHAPSSGKRVGRASLDNPYWREQLVGARSYL
ncbi:C40 family peptidase [Thiosocius teredinicola]|uniref:C40 family peptidase n=1 Tax=Thiosocius teredinicola TaxID=1973002 RepID=UPI0009912427